EALLGPPGLSCTLPVGGVNWNSVLSIGPSNVAVTVSILKVSPSIPSPRTLSAQPVSVSNQYSTDPAHVSVGAVAELLSDAVLLPGAVLLALLVVSQYAGLVSTRCANRPATISVPSMVTVFPGRRWNAATSDARSLGPAKP